ncbi:cell division protein FtsN [Vibrio sp.]|uniref:Cell division protein FtsN n=1 Tax=Vibrio viridaestus TaxID=2487322 RepID=A0A3N9TB46_9VIBR|nr:cell division protein FtsN [Vibrio viridaestus]MDC0610084.1 cell division protein FtsN [Vibrio sp.]RQW61319.1 cell division protein FtsN [Vibrio viridaestus]
MASRDYVKRGGGSPKKKAPRKQAAPRKGFPWRSGLLAIIAVCAFGTLLITLNGQPDPEPSVPDEVIVPKTTSPAVAPSQKKEVIPPPPTEKWDYVDILQNREIEVTAKDLPVSDIPYVMQCGAYKTMEQAEERKAKIAFQGLTSKIRKQEDSSWYRVVLGPYKFKRDAEKDKHKLQRAKINPCAIWKERQ